MSSWNDHTTAEEIVAAYADTIRGKNVVITGVRPDSLGLATVSALAAQAKTIFVATRSVAPAQQALDETRRTHPNADVRVVPIDLLDTTSIRKAATTILESALPIHVVINNAVILPGPLQHTAEGFETQMAGNHFGHFLFTSLLWPRILAAKSSDWQPRVVNMSAIIVLEGFKPRWDDLHYKLRPEEYNPHVAYAEVKSVVNLFSSGIAEKYGDDGKGVLSFSVHPGIILETKIASSLPKQAFIDAGVMDKDGNKLAYFKNLSAGAATTVYAAFAPEIGSQNGAFLSDCAVLPAERIPDYLTSSENVQKMWKVSEEACGIEFGDAA